MPEKVLVTGAFGFVGRHVARAAAARGYVVHGVGHGAWSRSEWREWGIDEWHVADVTLDTLVSYGGDPDIVFHCAGSGSVAFSMSHPAQDFERTVLTTLSTLEYVRLHRPDAKLVLPSSAGVYGNASSLPIRIDAPLAPASPYGGHKKMAEDLCRSYAAHFGVSAAIVRLFSVYGVGLRKQLLWDACGKLARGPAEFGGTGDETRDWIHVDDAAALMLAAADAASSACPLANGANGSATQIRKIVESIASEMGNGNAVRFSGMSRPGDPAHFAADIAEARGWGWQPTRSLAAEIARYVAWYQDGAP